MCVSSCKSVDIRIDIVKYEEGIFIVVRIAKKGYLLRIFSVKVKPCANGRNIVGQQSQQTGQTFSYVQTDATTPVTPNNVGSALFGVVASVCT